jgi:pilus assembly protein Flp/PilA
MEEETSVAQTAYCGAGMRLNVLLKDKSGATAIEYGLISAIVSIALISGLGAFASGLNNQFMYLASIINY